MLMSDIAANAWDNIGPPQKIEGDAIYYRCTKRERDCFDFLLNDVASGPAPARQLLCGLTWGDPDMTSQIKKEVSFHTTEWKRRLWTIKDS